MTTYRAFKHRLGLLAFMLLAACAADESLDNPELETDLDEQQQALRNSPQAFVTVSAGGAITSFASTIAEASAVVWPDPDVGSYSLDITNIAPAVPGAPGMSGTVQVTAVGAGAARCTLTGSWLHVGASVRVFVTCRLPGGDPVNAGFHVYYGRGQASVGLAAYTRVFADGTIVANANFNSSGLTNSVVPAPGAPGRYHVFLPGPAAMHAAALQVTAISHTAHCHPASRVFLTTAERVTVECFSNLGTLSPTPFTLNLASRSSTALHGLGAFTEVNAAGIPDPVQSHGVCGDSPPTVVRVGVGAYDVSFSRLIPHPAAFLVTALGSTSAHCKVEAITTLPNGTLRARIGCFSAFGARVDRAFLETLVAKGAACRAGF